MASTGKWVRSETNTRGGDTSTSSSRGGPPASIMRGVKAKPKIREVEIDGLVVLKIIRHCREFLPQPVTGQLLGLDQRDSLEVTNCFPFPHLTDESDPAAVTKYQTEMMVRLREVNVDSNTVGWYQSTFLGNHLSDTMIRTQFSYQEQIRNGVCLVYDPARSTPSGLSLKVRRLLFAPLLTRALLCSSPCPPCAPLPPLAPLAPVVPPSSSILLNALYR